VVSRVRQTTGVEVPVRTLFERPTIAGLAPRIERALQGGATAGEPLATEPREGLPPLSFAQERLWFLSRLSPEDSAYNMPFQVRLRGVLDAGALSRSLTEVVRRHESLRTAFRMIDGRAVQVIAPPAAADGLAMPLADLSALPGTARAAEARRLAVQEATRPFALEAGPLLRTLLVRLAPEEHLALLATHHIVSDAWSTGVLFREVAALYPALREGRPPLLPELPIQYADFAIWQRRRLSGETLAAKIAWWREHLGDGPPPLDLPTDRPRPAVQDYRGGSRTQTLSPELARSIAALGRREGATLFMVLLAAFQSLLGRWSGQEDVVVGTPVAGRDRRETEGLIGLFLNTLALRTRLGGNPTFRELLGRVRDTALGAYAHAELPFEKLVEELRPPRDLSRNPIFDVMLNVVNTPPARAEIPGLELAFEESANPGAKFSLTLYASERESRIDLHLVYQAALFTPERAAVILDQLAALLEQAVAEPDRPLLSSSLVTASSRELLPDPSVPFLTQRYETVPALFEEQAARAPEAPAVRQGGRAWSYGELAERSFGLARALAGMAGRRGETVAVSGVPSFGLVAVLLAVLRSGGVMLTLDPALPPARRRIMAREAGARRLVLVDAAASDEGLLPEVKAVLCVDPESGRLLADGDGVPGSPPDAVPPLPAPEEPAYVFFTSGSTGVPKGILGCHRGVSHFLSWQRETFRIGPGDRCAQLTALSFDALLRDVFLPLTSGATLCLPDAAGLPPAQIVPWLEREEITLVHTLPAVAQAWAGSLGRQVPLPALRWIFFSGEPLADTLVRRLRRAFPGEATVVNLYGPTETTMTKCFYVVPAEPVPGIQPLGHPLPETQALVLGPEDRLCGIGEAGEIVLRTPFRTLGYLNAPEESWRRFVPNPFRDDADDLLYRTGDRGRYRPDGSLEILGRLDEQVKVRGVRVEPGEVEAALLRHPSVAAAAVVARPDASGEQRLIAYVARAEGRSPSASELREYLRQELPDPLLPAACVVLEALPHGPTGKIDRRALPDPEALEPSRSGYAAPRTALERAIAEIWQEVLQLDRVGLQDNFFDLGGHSLRLVEVHSRLTSRVGGELPLVELFRHPTVSALARYLEGIEQGGTAPAARAAGRSRAVREAESRAIAIVGMGGRFPGAADLEQFWRNLCDGVDSVTFFTDQELLASGVSPATLASPRYVKAGSVIDGIDRFDAAFFGFTPREAEILDPQHRLFLELSWEVLERAGYDPKRYPDPIGVYAGVHRSTYLLNLYSHPELVRAVGDGILKQTTDKDYLTTRVSYKLGLRGPSFTVQTTCSTSLVAAHLACQAILAGDCRMALAGGVSVRVPQEQGYFREEGDILSPDGHCRPFDAEGRGTIFTNGLGLVLLKHLEDAVADGDTIHAVIRGTAINNDGSDKVGYTAPSVDGQAEVIAAAQRAAGVHPDTVEYVEAHGTATLLGDPIEIAALTRAFRDGGATRRGFCAIGSVKSNVGHLDTAAGVAGLIKAALALEHGLIPPSLHFEKPNPNIDFESSPFYVNGVLTEWRTAGEPKRAGVSSFGIGGTNAHAVLEEPPRPEPAGSSRPWQLLLLSARTPAALEAATARLAEHLEQHPEVELADAAFTLQVGRRVFEHRRTVLCRDREDALVALRSPERWTSGSGDIGERPVAFLFPGQGSQHANMGRDLYETEPTFREMVDSCAALLEPPLGLDLRGLLFPAPGEAEAAGRMLTETRFAQPVLFVIEHALARLWMEWGIRPAAMIGHSLGEYVAACLAGVFSLPDALTLVAARGRLMQELPPGGMLAVSLPEEPLRTLLADIAPEASLSAVNAPMLCSVSGPPDTIDALAARLAEHGVEHRRLHTSHAFHSAMMDPVLRPFAELVGGIELRPPRLRFVSNVTGTWIRAADATDPGYWARHLREPVRFSEGISALLAEPGLALLEVGPGRTLSSLVRQHETTAGQTTVASMRHPKADGSGPEVLLRGLGRLWLAGAEPDWAGFYARERRRRVPLPTYPFERKRHWVDRHQGMPAAGTRPVALLLPGGDPAWAGHLAAAGWQIVTPPERPLDPDRPEDVAALLAALRQAVGPAAGEAAHREDTEDAGDAGDTEDTRPAAVAEGPGSPAERQLAALWEELLGVRVSGTHDDFFELGGHSLMATRLVARIRETFRVELPIEAVFAAPTLARLAARIQAEGRTGQALPPIVRVPRTERMPLSFAQQRLLFLEVLTPEDISYNMPLALRLQGPLDAGALRGALEGLVRRHEILRTTYALSKGNAWQVVAPPPAPGTHPVPTIDLRGLPAEAAAVERERLASAEMRRPIDIFRGPVFRSTLLRLGAEDHALLITIHHIATDGWSWGILYGELVEIYEKLCEERAPRLPELPVQYADYAAWQRGWLNGGELERQIGYWREKLAGLPLTEVPPDHARPAVRTGRGSLEPFSLPAEPTEVLRHLGRSEEATLFMVLLSSFCVLLHHYWREDDLVIGTDVANRRWKEAEGLIGLFVNQLVIRTGVAGDPTFRELLRRIRRTALDAYANQDAPFDKLVEMLNPARDMSRTPLFQVKLVLQNASAETRVSRGLAVSLLGFHNQTAKFDLLLNLSESGAGLAGNLEYSTDLYERETAVALLGHFAAVLRAVAERPDARLSEIEAALTERDRTVRERRRQERRETRSLAVDRVRRKAIAVSPELQDRRSTE
jgi:amino acid adenylation domain-containing protein